MGRFFPHSFTPQLTLISTKKKKKLWSNIFCGKVTESKNIVSPCTKLDIHFQDSGLLPYIFGDQVSKVILFKLTFYFDHIIFCTAVIFQLPIILSSCNISKISAHPSAVHSYRILREHIRQQAHFYRRCISGTKDAQKLWSTTKHALPCFEN